jgi:hypothetical protein
MDASTEFKETGPDQIMTEYNSKNRLFKDPELIFPA